MPARSSVKHELDQHDPFLVRTFSKCERVGSEPNRIDGEAGAWRNFALEAHEEAFCQKYNIVIIPIHFRLW